MFITNFQCNKPYISLTQMVKLQWNDSLYKFDSNGRKSPVINKK